MAAAIPRRHVSTTPARGPEDRPSNAAYLKAADQIYPTDRAIETARNGGFTTAVTFPTGNIFSGQGSVIDLAGDAPGEMVIADSVGQYIAFPSGGRRRRPRLSRFADGRLRLHPADLSGCGTLQARQVDLRKASEGLPRPAYDRTLEGVLASPRVLLPATRDVEIVRMLAFAKEIKLNAVLYGGHEAWRATDLLKKAGVPVLVSLKYPERAPDTDPAVEESLRVLELRDKAPTAAGALAKAGVKFAFYSDGLGTPRELMRAVKKAVDAGLARRCRPARPDADACRNLRRGQPPGQHRQGQDRQPGGCGWRSVRRPRPSVKYVFVDGGKFEPLP